MNRERYIASVAELLEASANARDETLMVQARLQVESEPDVNDYTTDMLIAREVDGIADRMRQLNNRGLVRRFIGRSAMQPKKVKAMNTPLLKLDGFCSTQPEFIDDTFLVDEFSITVPKNTRPKKDALNVERRVKDLFTDESQLVGSWGVVIEKDSKNNLSQVKITDIENATEIMHRFVDACKIFNRYSANYPWLSAYHVDHGNPDFAVTIKMDGTLETLQTLVGGDESERTNVLNELDTKIAELKRWNYTDEENRYMILGVLLGARKQLKIK